MTKNIHMHYFSFLREKAGCSSEDYLTDANTPKEVYKELALRYKFPELEKLFSVAINDEFQKWDTAIKEGDTLVFIPPIAGG